MLSEREIDAGSTAKKRGLDDILSGHDVSIIWHFEALESIATFWA